MFNQTDTELPGNAVIDSGYWDKNLARNYPQIGALKLICDSKVSVFKGVAIEDGVYCSPPMVFTNVYYPRAEIYKLGWIIIIGNNFKKNPASSY